ADAIKSALSNDIILICGGLGPTGDDVTRDAVALAAGKKLYEDETCRLSAFYGGCAARQQTRQRPRRLRSQQKQRSFCR
ncbi:MAG: hypothetical protein IKC99_04295, partial [Clostridia bacterium]|nr:hypothetical protein [Clostridia bacterium]